MTDANRQQVKQMFDEKLQGNVTALLFHAQEPGQEEPYTDAAREILTELSGLSGGRITFREIRAAEAPEQMKAYGITELPALAFESAPGSEKRVLFYGAPVGYEFMVLLEDLIDLSRGEVRLTDSVRAEIAAINTEIKIQVFTTPT